MVLDIIEEPREILKKMGIEIVEMEKSKKTSQCCGGGGGLLMSDVELSDELGKTRIRQAIDTGAPILVTPCPTCEQVLKKAATSIAESGEGNITVRNINHFIWKALK